MYSAKVLPIFDHMPSIIFSCSLSSIFPKAILIFFFIISFDLKKGPKNFTIRLPILDAFLTPIILKIENSEIIHIN